MGVFFLDLGLEVDFCKRGVEFLIKIKKFDRKVCVEGKK